MKALTPDEIPESFMSQIRQILANLHNFSFLQGNVLARSAASLSGSGEAGWQRLRKDILLSIESLNPGAEIYFRSPRARLYNLLNLHYLEEMSIQQAAVELGISLRQANRDLRNAERSLAALLWQRYAPEEQETSQSPTPAETENIEISFHPADLGAIVTEALDSVVELAQAHQNSFQIVFPEQPLMVSTNAMIAEQLLVHVFSQIVQLTPPGTLLVQIHATPMPVLEIHFPPNVEIEARQIEIRDPVVLTLMERLGWNIRRTLPGSQQNSFALHLGAENALLLIIDDNEGLPVLLERYLAGHPYRLISANDGEKGLAMAQQICPQVIILDIMMPGMDGWKVLRRLRAQETNRTTPVIICSVFKDVALAQTLGASLILSKPLKQEDLLNALHQVGL